MNKRLILPVLLLTLLVGTPAFSGDLRKGLTAYKSGDYATALRELEPLAEQGDASVQTLVGGMYGLGQGVPQDHKTSVKWFRRAAKQGHAYSQSVLGFAYANGRGVPQDYKTAVKWYRLAAEQGNASAQNKLGRFYVQGKGVIQDNVYAHMWWNIAASSENKVAVENRDILTKQMTPSQLEKAQDLARECVRKKYKGC